MTAIPHHLYGQRSTSTCAHDCERRHLQTLPGTPSRRQKLRQKPVSSTTCWAPFSDTTGRCQTFSTRPNCSPQRQHIPPRSASATPGSPPADRNSNANSTLYAPPAAAASSPRSSPARTPTDPSSPPAWHSWPRRHPDRPRVRPARSVLQDLITTVTDRRGREVGFASLYENLDTTTPGGRLVFHVFAALAEFIRELIVSSTREGLAAARARSRVGGRPTVINPDLIAPPAIFCPTPTPGLPPSPAPRRQPRHARQPHPRPTRTPRGWTGPNGDRVMTGTESLRNDIGSPKIYAWTAVPARRPPSSWSRSRRCLPTRRRSPGWCHWPESEVRS